MKIGLFTDGYLPQINGVATSVEELQDSLTIRDHKVYIVAPRFPKYKDKAPNIFRLKSFRLYKNPELRLSYMFPDKIFQKVLKVDFDIIHGFSGGSIPSLGLALAKFKKIPYVFTYNTRLNHYTHYFLGGKVLRPKAVEKIVELYCNVCDHVIAPAEYVKDELIEFGVKKPITVIPNGVNTKVFKPENKDYLRKKLGLLEKDKIVLYVGRLAKEKSIDFLLKSFARLQSSHARAGGGQAKLNRPNTYFVIVGDGPERKNLEDLSTKLGVNEKTIFLGATPHFDLAKIYNGGDIFIFASSTETQGLVVPEAMACGLPVLTIEDKVFRQFIDDGIDGFMVKKNENIFALKLNEILNDDSLRLQVSQKAHEKVSTKYSLDEVAKKFENLYKQL